MSRSDQPHLWKPGQSGNPNGRPKGSPNKETTEIKEAYVNLIHGNLHEIQNWINRVAERNPEKAFDMLMKLSPFVLPKKQEVDMNIDNPIQILIPKPKDDSES